MRQFQVSVWLEDDIFVAQCLEVDIASQGATGEEALSNLREALELFFETASPEEVRQRVHVGVSVSRLEIAVG